MEDSLFKAATRVDNNRGLHLSEERGRSMVPGRSILSRMDAKLGDVMEALTKYTPNIEVVSDPESLAQRSVEVFVAKARKAIEARDALNHQRFV